MKTILVIEDNPIYRAYVCFVLETQGFRVIEADNGFNGLGLAIELQPDVIVCDVELPKANGFKVLQAIRKHSTTASIPFIFLTADSSTKNRDRALAMGANAYLNKIIETQTLTQIILEQSKYHSPLINDERRKHDETFSDTLSSEAIAQNACSLVTSEAREKPSHCCPSGDCLCRCPHVCATGVK